MNPFRPSLVLATFALFSLQGWAQCPFDPTVTPANLILCPNSQDTLATQAYDSYQWYKAGVPIPGATGQTHVVDAYNDAAYMFRVEATLAGCTEMSPEVLVDGWAFLPPTVMTTGADPLYFSQNGPVFCALDTVLLVMMLPYDINIQWTNGGNVIPGATDDTLVVTTQGQYSASGAPSICPDFVQQLGVWVDVLFTPPTQPVILQNSEQLCADPPGDAYQWYVDGYPVPNGNTECITGTQPGSYTVDVTYPVDCSIPSEVFLVTGIDDHGTAAAWAAYPNPTDQSITLNWDGGSSIDHVLLLDATGRTVLNVTGPLLSPLTIGVNELAAGRYSLSADGRVVTSVSIVR